MDDDFRAAPVIYFHGLPGSERELALVNMQECEVPRVLDPLDFEYFSQRTGAHSPAKVVGFSLGAFSAVKLAASRPDVVSELVLISAAAPLETGSFLDEMAGAPVFRAARASAAAFAALTAAQAFAAHVFPEFLLKRMFAKSCDAEKAILKDPAARRCLTDGLRHSLWHSAPMYRRAVTEYVQPWQSDLSEVQCPCRVFHGELDDWVPLGMAETLIDSLPSGSTFQVEKNLGHYSTLVKVLPNVLKRSANP